MACAGKLCNDQVGKDPQRPESYSWNAGPLMGPDGPFQGQNGPFQGPPGPMMGPQRPNIIDLINAYIQAGQKNPPGPPGTYFPYLNYV